MDKSKVNVVQDGEGSDGDCSGPRSKPTGRNVAAGSPRRRSMRCAGGWGHGMDVCMCEM